VARIPKGFNQSAYGWRACAPTIGKRPGMSTTLKGLHPVMEHTCFKIYNRQSKIPLCSNPLPHIPYPANRLLTSTKYKTSASAKTHESHVKSFPLPANSFRTG
jgi:hypothetical protein